MDSYLYKRKSDGKLFCIKKTSRVFIGVLNWYEGPHYENSYELLEVSDTGGYLERVITMDLLTDYDRTNKLTNNNN